MIEALCGTIDALRAGKLKSVGVCAMLDSGQPSFFYMDQADHGNMLPALGKLVGLYKSNLNGFGDRVNAPYTNRSYETH